MQKFLPRIVGIWFAYWPAWHLSIYRQRIEAMGDGFSVEFEDCLRFIFNSVWREDFTDGGKSFPFFPHNFPSIYCLTDHDSSHWSLKKGRTEIENSKGALSLDSSDFFLKGKSLPVFTIASACHAFLSLYAENGWCWAAFTAFLSFACHHTQPWILD